MTEVVAALIWDKDKFMICQRPALFNAIVAEGTPQKLEHNDIRWITVEEIPQYAFCPADERTSSRNGILKG